MDSQKKYQRYQKGRHLKRVYGITLAIRDKIIAEQGGKCPGCGDSFASLPHHRAHIDHNKETREINGVLCQHCNHAKGQARDSAEICRRLADYIESPPFCIAMPPKI